MGKQADRRKVWTLQSPPERNASNFEYGKIFHIGSLAGGYFLIVISISRSCAYLPSRSPGDSGESGVLLVIFAIPWIFFLDSIHVLASLPASEIINTFLILIIPVILNAFIIYILGNVLGNALKNVDSETATVGGLRTESVNALWKTFNIVFWAIFILYFFPLLQIIIPISGPFLGICSIVSIVHWFGGSIVLGYFGYALTLKRHYLLLGLLGLMSFLNIGLLIGYAVLYKMTPSTVRRLKAPA